MCRLRAKRPSVGFIPNSALWFMNTLGLNMFIAVIGIQRGPVFIPGIEQVGNMFFVMGVISTSVPLFIAMWMGAKLFKFHPSINLGCCAGGRTTVASSVCLAPKDLEMLLDAVKKANPNIWS